MDLFAFGIVASPVAYVIIGLIAILLFGNRLPKVARSLGSSVIEFKKGVKDLKDIEKDIKKDIDLF